MSTHPIPPFDVLDEIFSQIEDFDVRKLFRLINRTTSQIAIQHGVMSTLSFTRISLADPYNPWKFLEREIPLIHRTVICLRVDDTISSMPNALNILTGRLPNLTDLTFYRCDLQTILPGIHRPRTWDNNTTTFSQITTLTLTQCLSPIVDTIGTLYHFPSLSFLRIKASGVQFGMGGGVNVDDFNYMNPVTDERLYKPPRCLQNLSDLHLCGTPVTGVDGFGTEDGVSTEHIWSAATCVHSLTANVNDHHGLQSVASIIKHSRRSLRVMTLCIRWIGPDDIARALQPFANKIMHLTSVHLDIYASNADQLDVLVNQLLLHSALNVLHLTVYVTPQIRVGPGDNAMELEDLMDALTELDVDMRGTIDLCVDIILCPTEDHSGYYHGQWWTSLIEDFTLWARVELALESVTVVSSTHISFE